MDVSVLTLIGLGLVFLGIVVLVAAAILIAVLHNKNGKVKAAGVIVIGPVPIVFGSDKKTVRTILKLSIALTALLIVLSVIYYFLLR